MWGATPSKSGATGGSRRGDAIWGLAGYRAGREVVVDWIGLTRNSLSLSRLRTRDGRCGLPAILAGSLNILRQTGGGAGSGSRVIAPSTHRGGRQDSSGRRHGCQCNGTWGREKARASGEDARWLGFCPNGIGNSACAAFCCARLRDVGLAAKSRVSRAGQGPTMNCLVPVPWGGICSGEGNLSGRCLLCALWWRRECRAEAGRSATWPSGGSESPILQQVVQPRPVASVHLIRQGIMCISW